MKGYDPFERSVRETLGSYEVPYNSADWAQLERRLDSGAGTGRTLSTGLIALLLGGVLVTSGVVWTLVKEDKGGAAVEATAPTSSQPTSAHSEALAETQAVEPEAATDTRFTKGQTEATANAATTSTSQAATRPMGHATGQGSMKGGTPTGTLAEAAPSPSTREVAIRPSVTEGCPGTTVSFDAQNLPEGGIYLWNFGDGSFSNKPSPSHTFSKSGVFEVMLSHSSMGGGNISNKPASDRIVIHEVPEASFNFMKREYDNTVPSVHFENRSMGGQTYLWDFGDGTTSATPHPDHVYKQKGAYHVTLTVVNAKGCTDRTERTVRIDEDYNLLATKTFSPNGDGMEDLFIPEALKSLGVKFHLTIHDPRTGQLVYETSDPQRPWNGRIGGRGELCAPGDYVWMVEMKDGEKVGGTYNGSVSLLR